MERHTAAFHPTRGPMGSVYQTFDGKTYVRTPFGTRVVDSTVGSSLFYAYRLRQRTLLLGMLVSLVVGVVGLRQRTLLLGMLVSLVVGVVAGAIAF